MKTLLDSPKPAAPGRRATPALGALILSAVSARPSEITLLSSQQEQSASPFALGTAFSLHISEGRGIIIKP